jgi:hypothetical protein
MKRAKNPYWDIGSLTDHYAKRSTKDFHCWQALLKKAKFNKDDYKARSINIVQKCWLCFQAKKIDPSATGPLPKYHKLGKYHLDNASVLTITGINDDKIVTCYHEHGHSQCVALASSLTKPPNQMSSKSVRQDAAAQNQEKLNYINYLRNGLAGKNFIELLVGSPAQTPPSVIQDKIEELRSL